MIEINKIYTLILQHICFLSIFFQTVNLDVCVKSVVIPDSPVIVELFIHDTAGQDVFKDYIKKAVSDRGLVFFPGIYRDFQ